MTDRKLCLFICYAKNDYDVVHHLYTQLNAESWLDVWLDRARLLAGQDWEIEIEKAVEQADIVLVCLSQKAVRKAGYIQKELRTILKNAEKKPEGAIFIIPLRLDACEPPRSLSALQYVDYFPPARQFVTYRHLLKSIQFKAETLGISPPYPNRQKTSIEIWERIHDETAEKEKLERENLLKGAGEMAAKRKDEQNRSMEDQQLRPEAGKESQKETTVQERQVEVTRVIREAEEKVRKRRTEGERDMVKAHEPPPLTAAEYKKQAQQRFLEQVRQREQNRSKPREDVVEKAPLVKNLPSQVKRDSSKKSRPSPKLKNYFSRINLFGWITIVFLVAIMILELSWIIRDSFASTSLVTTAPVPLDDMPELEPSRTPFVSLDVSPASTRRIGFESMFVFGTLKPNNNFAWVSAGQTPGSNVKFLVYGNYDKKIVISGKYTKEVETEGPWYLYDFDDQCGWIHGAEVDINSGDLDRIPEVDPYYCLFPTATSTP